MSQKFWRKVAAALVAACLLCLTIVCSFAEEETPAIIVLPEHPTTKAPVVTESPATNPPTHVPEDPATRPPEDIPEDPTSQPSEAPTEAPLDPTSPPDTPTDAPTNPPATQSPGTQTRRPTAAPTPTPRITAVPVPTQEPLPTDTPAPEIVFTELDPSAQLHSISAAESLSVLDTMRILGIELQPEVDAGTTDVIVLHLDELLTPDELAAMGQLSVHDRLLVTLTVTGFNYVVRDALEQNPVLMSEEAVHLADAIALRIEELPEDERQAIQKAIQERFPLIVSSYDDMETIFYNVDIVVTQEEIPSYERYSFRFNNGTWLLTSIALGAME